MKSPNMNPSKIRVGWTWTTLVAMVLLCDLTRVGVAAEGSTTSPLVVGAPCLATFNSSTTCDAVNGRWDYPNPDSIGCSAGSGCVNSVGLGG
jgi:hypothetical protein